MVPLGRLGEQSLLGVLNIDIAEDIVHW